jgi:hypothetical protein
MEITRYLPNGDLVFNATGNTYIKMLNDVDKKLCAGKHLQIMYNSSDYNTIKFTAHNPKLINIDKYDYLGKKIRIYPDLEYINEVPVISHYFTDTEYVPTYMGYHDLDVVSIDTLKYFNINQPIINNYELQENKRFLDKEFQCLSYDFKKDKKIYKVPNVVCIYGNTKKINDIYISDDDDYSDDSTE